MYTIYAFNFKLQDYNGLDTLHKLWQVKFTYKICMQNMFINLRDRSNIYVNLCQKLKLSDKSKMLHVHLLTSTVYLHLHTCDNDSIEVWSLCSLKLNKSKKHKTNQDWFLKLVSYITQLWRIFSDRQSVRLHLSDCLCKVTREFSSTCLKQRFFKFMRSSLSTCFNAGIPWKKLKRTFFSWLKIQNKSQTRY